jgi:hypothetical protein
VGVNVGVGVLVLLGVGVDPKSSKPGILQARTAIERSKTTNDEDCQERMATIIKQVE